MKKATLLFLINKKENKILLGLKRRGFGVDKWNGIGGKVQPPELIIEAAIRETQEEIKINIKKIKIQTVAIFNYNFSDKPEWKKQVYVFIAKSWSGIPCETEEMRPKWFNLNEIPYSNMWEDDQYWLPQILAGEKLVGDFYFSAEAKMEKFTLNQM